MKCDDIKKVIILEYTDGRLNDEQRNRIEKHLGNCPDCCEFAEEARLMAAPFRDSEEISPPESVWENIKEVISEEEKAGAFDWIDRLREGVWLILTQGYI